MMSFEVNSDFKNRASIMFISIHLLDWPSERYKVLLQKGMLRAVHLVIEEIMFMKTIEFSSGFLLAITKINSNLK